jgi:hypothetical protein
VARVRGEFTFRQSQRLHKTVGWLAKVEPTAQVRPRSRVAEYTSIFWNPAMGYHLRRVQFHTLAFDSNVVRLNTLRRSFQVCTAPFFFDTTRKGAKYRGNFDLDTEQAAITEESSAD